tara:strand:- start:471 stop:752 length:282 start_codon:yes stop_codon:yes gene_type:complete
MVKFDKITPTNSGRNQHYESYNSSALDIMAREDKDIEQPSRLERVERKLLGLATSHYTDFDDPFDSERRAKDTIESEKPYFSVRDNSRQNTSM